jgi:hypothetical protein
MELPQQNKTILIGLAYAKQIRLVFQGNGLKAFISHSVLRRGQGHIALSSKKTA